jgi:acetyl esterase/lipase
MPQVVPQVVRVAESACTGSYGKPTVLFLCVRNAGRSRLAMGFFQHLAGDRAVAWSGGSEPGIAVNPARAVEWAPWACSWVWSSGWRRCPCPLRPPRLPTRRTASLRHGSCGPSASRCCAVRMVKTDSACSTSILVKLSCSPIPATSIKPYVASTQEQLAYLAGGPDELPAPYAHNLTVGRRRVLVAEPVTAPAQPWRRFQLPGAREFRPWVNLYPPGAAHDGLPPLLLRAHPGPRSQSRIRLDLEARFFTSRGYAVADVDYRGSTGYGRAFRNSLLHLWGVLDVEDCAAAARHLSDAGLVDPDRIVIFGESAGGYTALRALATTADFAAAVCISAIVDLEQYRQRTHKFQRYETNRLVGSFPEQSELYRQRSPASLVGGRKGDQLGGVAPAEGQPTPRLPSSRPPERVRPSNCRGG